ncbi:uncharacterized protein LOC107361803 isoform X2 [Tetranychus urticae]|uniref:F-box domain-containing protein n=1 Tax=Tetranychus urticae TaxID=32264 RepID=T1K8R5_TETUR|nr:uncharacterized protein LOC107361803 isoform X2 [Tetranychus urticae]
MLINELPDDCLLSIFDYMNDLGDLINCYKVCIKWSHLVAERTKKVKYFMEYRYDHRLEHGRDVPDYSFDCVYYEDEDPIDVTCLSTLFTNLIIAELSWGLTRKGEFEDIVTFVSNQKSLKGLINTSGESIEKYCDELEMLSCNSYELIAIRNGSSIKQLYFGVDSIDAFKPDLSYFPNLERLHIDIKAPDKHYDGPVLEKLKILESQFFCLPNTSICYVFQFMDLCPNLQSAHIFMNTFGLFVDETLKHECLQDLVVHIFGDEGFNWNNLKRLFMKYPNLKHLSLSSNWNITDEYIEQLVHILPNLVLLNFSGCLWVTQRAADYVQDYCKRHGRSIKFYFKGNVHEMESDWPQLSTKHERISRGFNFMKHCFFKEFYRLPHFLIPIHYE